VFVLPPEMFASCQERDANALQAMNCECRSTEISTSDGSSLEQLFIIFEETLTD